ncbi:MAG TPA: hypothetical protein DDY13_15550 [Cytophagales bacterium]|nr:hypothetical protein [Cytophagales bacterium]
MAYFLDWFYYKKSKRIIMKKIVLLLSFAIAPFLITDSIAQKHDDAKVTIKVNGKEVELEEYLEEMGERLERNLEKLEDRDTKIEININEKDWEDALEDLDIQIDMMSDNLEEFIEAMAHQIEEAVTHMDIEITDIDPDDINEGEINLNDDDFRDWINEIESKYGEIEVIDRLKLKIREEGLYANMDVSLQNGKEIQNLKRFFED